MGTCKVAARGLGGRCAAACQLGSDPYQQQISCPCHPAPKIFAQGNLTNQLSSTGSTIHHFSAFPAGAPWVARVAGGWCWWGATKQRCWKRGVCPGQIEPEVSWNFNRIGRPRPQQTTGHCEWYNTGLKNLEEKRKSIQFPRPNAHYIHSHINHITVWIVLGGNRAPRPSPCFNRMQVAKGVLGSDQSQQIWLI